MASAVEVCRVVKSPNHCTAIASSNVVFGSTALQVTATGVEDVGAESHGTRFMLAPGLLNRRPS